MIKANSSNDQKQALYIDDALSKAGNTCASYSCIYISNIKFPKNYKKFSQAMRVLCEFIPKFISFSLAKI